MNYNRVHQGKHFSDFLISEGCFLLKNVDIIPNLFTMLHVTTSENFV